MTYSRSTDKSKFRSRSLMFWDSHWSFNFLNDPKRLAFVLSRYKFCAKMTTEQSRILELGCSSGIGVPFLVKTAKSYTGVDLDLQAIEAAKKNYKDSNIIFLYEDFMGKIFGEFDMLVSLDVVEHIMPQYEHIYFETVANNLDADGVCVIGTPNITASAYASEYSKLGHVNLFSQQRLTQELQKHFHQVFSFGMNDEVIHTGYASMSHYLICLACHQKKSRMNKYVQHES